MLTKAHLAKLLTYDPATGVFVANCDHRKWRKGKEVGTVNMYGYRQIGIEGKVYLAHRLAWLYVYGALPKCGLDHINRQRSDNRILNLREASQTEQHQNRSSVVGAYQRKKDGKWIAQLKISSKQKHLGVFSTRAEAQAAYQAAKRVVHTFNPAI